MPSPKLAPLAEKLENFIRQEELAPPGKKVLLAVSGGVDSAVMAHLFDRTGYEFAIAHCNFSLRGEESDEDERFVRGLAEKLEAAFFVQRFDTALYAKDKGLSTQMAARELRYEWFSQVLRQEKYDLIATAHHKSDSLETILLNLAKGSVLQGLSGIPVKNGNIIRPLLFATKEEIVAYAEEHKISFREDSSNTSDKYRRNLLRRQAVPTLKLINPAVEETVFKAALARQEIHEWLMEYVRGLVTMNSKTTGDKVSVPIAAIRHHVPLYLWLSTYGFHFDEVRKLYKSLDSTEVKRFYSASHRVVKERDTLVLEPLADASPAGHAVIEQEQTGLMFQGVKFSFKVLEGKEVVDLKTVESAFLDMDRLQFPLVVRPWRHGDYFYPYGSGGRKKLSDFLTDSKLSHSQKEEQLVVLSGEDIVWVVGWRVDERYKVGEASRRIFCITAGDS